MDVAAYLPPLVTLVLGLFGRRLGAWLPPATAVRLLTVSGVAAAAATGFVLAIACFLVVARLPLVALLGGWSVADLASADPLPAAVGVLAGLAVAALLAAALRRVLVSGRDLAQAAIMCRRLGPSAGGLVVVDDERPDAYALPGLSGRVVVSTAMLRALPVDERRVLLAHEAAHLRHHHHAYLQLAELAAAANPLLRPVAVAVRAGVERWADEVAATEVGDRRLAARALARAGLAVSRAGNFPRPGATTSLAAVDTGVAERAQALLAGPPRRRRALAAAVAALAILSLLAAAETARETEHQFEVAQQAYTPGY